MSFTWIRSLVEYLTFLHYPKDDIKEQKRLMIKRSHTVFYSSLIMMGIVFILFLFNVGVFSSVYFEKNRSSLNLLAVLFVLLIFAGCVCYSRGVWKVADNLEMIKSLREAVTDLINNNQTEFKTLIEKQEKKLKNDYIGSCRRCEHFSDSINLIESSIGKYCNTHKLFVDHFKESIVRDPDFLKDLKGIQDDFNSFYYAELLCVILNPEYFDLNDDDTLSDLIKYFISFYPELKLNGERKSIKRIFCPSAIVVEGDSDEIKKTKSLWMFQYILSNYISEVEICYLIDETELVCHLDYVLGKFDKDDKLSSTRKFYFSYNVNGSEKQIESTDQILFNILEKDFYERWFRGHRAKKIIRKRITVKRNDKVNKIEEIAKELKLEKTDLITAFDNIQRVLNTCDRQEFEGHAEDLNVLKKRLTRVKNQIMTIDEIQKK